MLLKKILIIGIMGFTSSLLMGYGNNSGKGFQKPPMSAHPYAGEQSISGKIDLDASLKGKADLKFDDNDVIYVILNKHGATGGAPVAVKKIENLKDKTFPMDFMVGATDTMSGHEAAFVGPFSVKIKLSRTGDAMSNPGDLIGYSAKEAIKSGSKDVKINFTEVFGGK